MKFKNYKPMFQVVIPPLLEGKIKTLTTCDLTKDELIGFGLALKYSVIVLEKDNISRESFHSVHVFFLGEDEINLIEDDNSCTGCCLSVIIIYIERLRKMKDFRKIMVTYVEELAHHFWNIEDEILVKNKVVEIMKYMDPNFSLKTLKELGIHGL